MSLASHGITLWGMGAKPLSKWLEESIEGVDLCDLAKGVCKGNLGIPRKDMPQLEAESPVWRMEGEKGEAALASGADPHDSRPLMFQFLDTLVESGVPVVSRQIPVGELKATQRELDAGKIMGMVDNYTKGEFPDIIRSIIVSKDGYVLDGHHRWAALLLVDPSTKMYVKEVGLPIREILPLANSYPGVYHTDINGKVL